MQSFCAVASNQASGIYALAAWFSPESGVGSGVTALRAWGTPNCLHVSFLICEHPWSSPKHFGFDPYPRVFVTNRADSASSNPPYISLQMQALVTAVHLSKQFKGKPKKAEVSTPSRAKQCIHEGAFSAVPSQ